ncbi:Npun_F0813 family protein [Mastigocoleus testarum]|uniref:Uncharacterized protein n=1 Tax=Mastigocoleus testarum BC008 TaxID=371196 RepID=A0A0V7ZEN7_9CYAN|nr:Npun_F0813 family protein [Mastigocoleus testarum]KST62947.1 hypothetical protein BC008_11560 [Mastigocoleus testarum BC008]KST63038.1 hypothetical protein BC008_12035 [Mastigocoleus testarum BC008]
MFILKREDVEISTVLHPKRDQQVPILYYQEQTFRLIKVFPASQEEEAKSLWRELTDNRGKACVLLEEIERYSIWGKVRIENLGNDSEERQNIAVLVQGSILLLQAIYLDIEEFLGSKQASLFEKDIAAFFGEHKFPQVTAPQGVKLLLNFDPFQTVQVPIWQETHIVTFLQELHRLGKSYFGNTNFAHPVAEKLQDMPQEERSQFTQWLNESSLKKLWH